MSSPLTDPRTGVRRGEATLSRAPEVDKAVAAAATAAPAWRALPGRERARRLGRLADLIAAHHDEYVARERAGTGKPLAEAAGEVDEVVDLFRYFAQAARAALAPAGGQLIDEHESWVRWEPVGVVAVVVPWNYPLMMAAWRCAPALATGNVVLLKPAETTPDSALLLAEDAAEALGDAVVQVVPGDRATGQLLVASDVDAVAFTGSLRGGLDVAARSGVRRLSLELGGNCPVVLLPDAPEDTWSALAAAAVYNAGQSCAAPARVITLRENYAETVDRLGTAMAERVAGVDFGPMNSAEQAERLDRIRAESRAGHVTEGTVQVGPDERGGFWRPAAVLSDLPEDDPAVLEELFGPVLTVQCAEDLGHAVAMANSVPQALAASVWSRDVRRALRVAAGIDAGEVWVNCHLAQTAELPHGGRGDSGTGTDLSVLSLHEYQRPKTVTVKVAD
jgi:betaine-aldehyde dehydrogenase